VYGNEIFTGLAHPRVQAARIVSERLPRDEKQMRAVRDHLERRLVAVFGEVCVHMEERAAGLSLKRNVYIRAKGQPALAAPACLWNERHGQAGHSMHHTWLYSWAGICGGRGPDGCETPIGIVMGGGAPQQTCACMATFTSVSPNPQDKVHFNGKSDQSERLPNTCNVSLLGEACRNPSFSINKGYAPPSMQH
jgi:hypothetical protein